MGNSSVTRQVIAGLLASLSALAGAFHTGWSSPSLVKLLADDSDLQITSNQGSWIASMFNIGIAFGAIATSLMANKWGRKYPLLGTMIPISIACILIIVANNFWWLLIARFIAGLGYGGLSPLVLMYTGEIADDKIRGGLSVFFNQMTSFGILIAYSVGPWVSREILGYVGLSLPFIFALTFVWMPESPYYLMTKKRDENAEKSLSWLRGTGDVTEELKKIQDTIDNEEIGTIRELIMTPGNRKALTLVTVITVAPQLSGIFAILSYTGVIFEASESGLSSSISTIICGVVQLICGGLSIFVVDLFGRRPLLFASFAGSIIFLLAEALYFQLQYIGADVSSISWLPVTAIIGYIIFYSFGLGCVPFVILAEIMPYNMKSVLMISAFTVVALSSVAVIKLYQLIADAFGIQVSFYVFAGCSIILSIYIYLVLPETKQKSFRTIQEELRSSTDSKIVITERSPE